MAQKKLQYCPLCIEKHPQLSSRNDGVMLQLEPVVDAGVVFFFFLSTLLPV